jgi:nucleotide-binding universal stress UspA family protein
MFKHILMPTDGSEHSERAIVRGIELAKLCNARVTGIHVVPDYHLMIAYEGAFDPVTEEKIEEEARQRAASFLDFVKKTAAAANVSCDTVVATSDHPYDAIVNAANERGCDLIVMTLRSQGTGVADHAQRSKPRTAPGVDSGADVPRLMSADHPDRGKQKTPDAAKA